MNSSTLSRRSVDVFADVVVAAPAGRLSLQGSGRTLAISASRWSALHGTPFFPLRRSRRERRLILSRLGTALEGAGIELSLQIDGREIARMGEAGRAGLVARGLALPGVRLRPLRLVGSLLRSTFLSREAG